MQIGRLRYEFTSLDFKTTPGPRDLAEVKVARPRSRLAALNCFAVVINIPPSVLISDLLRYLRAVTLMTQRCALKTELQSRQD